MPSVILLRHAEALPDSTTGRDYDRPLSPVGREQVQDVRGWLDGMGVLPQRIIASPSMRTRQTTELLGLQAGMDYVDGLYDNHPDRVRSALCGVTDEIEHLLIVGHAPSTPMVAEELSAGGEASDSFFARSFGCANAVRLDHAGHWVDLADSSVVLTFIDGFRPTRR
ncbi:MAG: SixA phosphatase family protein [Propionibacteriaceae bacterium]